MSTLKINRTQFGQSNTATNNFTLTAEAADGTIKLARGNAGATTQDVLTVDASGNLGSIDNSVLERMVLRTAVATTSGTSVDFTGIPSWVKKITVMFKGVSTSGSTFPMVQLGSGSLTTTGYTGGACYFTNGGAVVTNTQTAGFAFSANAGASDVRTGQLTLSLLTGNTWVGSAVSSFDSGGVLGFGAGSVALSGSIDRVRVTTSNGTDTFDGGSVNILLEG